MQNLQSPTLKHSNVERQKSELMSNSARSDSNQIVLHRDNDNAELEIQLQEVTSSPTVPPSFKAAAAAAADIAATVAAMTSVHPYVANFDRGSTPTATLHYMPPHPHNGQLLQSHIGCSQQQSRHGLMPRQPMTGHMQAPRNATPSQQAPQHGATPLTEEMQPPRHAAPQPPHHATPSQQTQLHGAAPPMVHYATQHEEQHTAGDTRERHQACRTGTVAKQGHVRDVPMNVRNYTPLGRSQG